MLKEELFSDRTRGHSRWALLSWFFLRSHRALLLYRFPLDRVACPGSFLQEQAEWNAVLDGEMKAKGKRTVLVMGTRVMHVSLPA